MHIPQELARVTTMAFDVDGTLTDANHQVSAASLAALRKLDQAGVTVIIITGRAPVSAAATLHEAGLHGWVSACNGAHISDAATGEVLSQVSVPAEVVRQTLDVAEAEDMACSVFQADQIHVSRPGMLYDFIAAANPGKEPVVGDIRAFDPSTILKLMPGAEKDHMARVFPRFRQITPLASLSLDETCEVIAAGAGKEDGLRFLLDHLDLDPSRVAGFGDGGNDVGWLSMVGWPVAMANARDEVKDIARLVIGHHLDDGIAEFVDAWLEAREQLEGEGAGSSTKRAGHHQGAAARPMAELGPQSASPEGQPSGEVRHAEQDSDSVRDQIRAVHLPRHQAPGQPEQVPAAPGRDPRHPVGDLPRPPVDFFEEVSDDQPLGQVGQGEHQAVGVFEIDLNPQESEAEGAIYRFGFTKNWTGDLEASGTGVMLSGGDPALGSAGYVAIETVRGSLLGHQGSFLLQQFGDLDQGAETLHYQVVNGSGTEQLTGLRGQLDLDIDEYGTHRYELTFTLTGGSGPQA